MKQKIAAIIEARMTSTRLPGKVMKEWEGKPLIQVMVERLQKASRLDDVIVATTTNPKDDVLCNFLAQKNINFYRGSEENVLLRVLEAAKENKVSVIVECTGDCPLIDPKIVDQSIEHFFNMRAAYVGNTCITDKYPRGVDTKVFSTETLEEVNNRWGDDKDNQEHVSLPIYRHQEVFKCIPLPPPSFFIHPKTRLTLDYVQDLEVIRTILHNLGENCSLQEICKFLDEFPVVRDINGNLNISYINDADRNSGD